MSSSAICGARQGNKGGVSEAEIRSRLAVINTVYPGTSIACVMAPNGTVLAQHTAEGVKFDEVQAVIASLKLAAINFGEAAGELDCHVIHIKGNSHLFSCYDIGRGGHLLAFYSEMHATSIELFDTSVADTQLQPLLAVLEGMLRQLPAQ